MRLAVPDLAKRSLVHVALGRSRHERRTVRKALVVGGVVEAPVLHSRLDLRAPGGERLDHLARDPRNLEAPVRVRALQLVAQAPQPLGQLGTVDRADRLLLAVEAVVHHGAPAVVRALNHVGDDAVCV